jgi:Spy/CpxP family protein refolding chaperone
MKRLAIILSMLMLGAAAYAADLTSKSTDELLQMRGTMTTQQERNELHNELMIREKTMTQEQLQKFHTYPPENRVRKYQNQGPGKGMGPGQGMGAGQGKGMGKCGGANR